MASVAQAQQGDQQLNTIFLGLKQRNPELRTQAAEELKRYVSAVNWRTGELGIDCGGIGSDICG